MSRPEPPPPPELVPDDAPATVGELRTLKRWLVVAGVWAVAASAIAIIALLEANKDEPKRPGGVTNAQLSGVQRDLDQRIDALEKQVKGLPRSEDLSKLEKRLKAAEDHANSARDDVKAVRTDVDDLKKRVDSLERQQQNQATTPNSGGTQTTP